ncbi:hypothetical protein [Aquimarina aggregata]|uniref:hypothetical protein n=1 Tax=Aquimarina aggregata TaxID=1642818 RepID=UPI0024902605|nr:hypothetical protein [Aquimarina aggregata]
MLNGGDTQLETITGLNSMYFGGVFPEGEAGGAASSRRGGHNVSDGFDNIISILNDFCKNNPGQCQETNVEEK